MPGPIANRPTRRGYAVGMARVLLLLPSTSYRAHDLLRAARALQLDVVIGTDRRQALEAAAPGGTLSFDPQDPAAALARIEECHAAEPFLAVLGVDDETAALAALACERLGLPGNRPEVVAALRDKWRFRQAQAAAGQPHPWHMRMPTCGTDPRHAAARMSYPCVLKPTFLAASRGVIRADGASEFVAAWERIRALLSTPDVRSRGGELADHILVEGYLEGAELALEGLLHDGTLQVLALFDKPDALCGPYFEETLLVTPSQQPGAIQTRIIEAIGRTLSALGLRHGPVHAEVRVSPTGAVHVLEIAPRSIGGHCSRALRFGSGRSLEEIVLLQATGVRVGACRREQQAAGVMMIPVPTAGTLRSVRGVSAARRIPGIEEITISIRRGQPVVPLPEGNRYLGFLFARATTPQVVESSLRAAHRCLRIDIEQRGEPNARPYFAAE